MTTVHAQPDYQLQVKHPAPPGYPAHPVPDRFDAQPGRAAFAERREAYRQHILRNPSPHNTKAVYSELVRLSAGGQIHEGLVLAACDYIDARKDCADFALHSILRLLYQFGQDPRISTALKDRCRQTALGFKYWPDEPGIDSLCTWTENHHILYASAAYLVGQLYPDQIFANSGHTGQQKIALNRPRILRWLDLRFRTGFSEWLSHVYYDEDLVALISLVDFCQDEAIRTRAAMVIDLILFDMALNSYKGVFGSTHGRSYENTKKWASNEGTTDTAKLLFGAGQFSGFDNMSASAFALSSYTLPPVLESIAQEVERPEMLNLQRMGIRLSDAEQLGLGFQSFEDGMTWLTLEAYIHPRTIALTLRMFDAYNWWENRFFSPLKAFRGLLQTLRRLHLLRPLAATVERDVCRNTREQVNIMTYRTPDYALSTAQDYRAGFGGDQQHIWQATLGPDAVCFTTHPGRLTGASPDYWTGSGLLPRAAQVKNVALVIYQIEKIPALYVPTRLFFTHAWLPRDRFDEVIEREGWIFARKGSGYLALRSQRAYRWQDQPGEDRGREIIADGAENIWICEMGREALNGRFENFVDTILRARLEFGRLSVRYHSPSQGLLEFGRKGALRQNGRQVNLGPYPRYDNPYCQAEFQAEQIEIRAGEHQLGLDGRTGERTYD